MAKVVGSDGAHRHDVRSPHALDGPEIVDEVVAGRLAAVDQDARRAQRGPTQLGLLVEDRHQRREHLWVPDVVVVQEDDELGVGVDRGEAPIAGRGDARVGAVEHPHTIVDPGVALGHLGRGVSRAVVDHDKLPVLERLGRHAVERLGEVLG